MVKESNMAFFSLLIGFSTIFCSISKILKNSYITIIAAFGIMLALITLLLSIKNKKKIKAKRDKYIFAITLSVISLVFNFFLFICQLIFLLVK